MSNNLVSNIKLASGCSLRKTCNHDGSKPRYFAYAEILGKSKFYRISKDLYQSLNNGAKDKCAFTTNILNSGKVQYTHSIKL